MRAAWPKLLGLMAILALVVSVQADDKDKNKEQTLKGTITCAKCDLHVKGLKKCATVVQVKDKKGKETVYYFDKAADKKYHKKICREAAKGEVTGTVSEKDGKKTIKVSKVKYAEEKDKKDK